jgi:hypothetical protein
MILKNVGENTVDLMGAIRSDLLTVLTLTDPSNINMD